MIGSLVRLLGLGGAPRASAPRFAPRLEVLDGRTLPSVTAVGVIDGGGGMSGGVLGSEVLVGVDQSGGADGIVVVAVTRSTGEEIPQTV